MVSTIDFTLSRNRFGRLRLIAADGLTHENVLPIRAFPMQAPHQNIAIVCPDGREIAWITDLESLSGPNRCLIEEELANSEFMPEIQRIRRVTSYATPCTWEVETDRGTTALVLRGEEDIRRIGQSTLLVADTHGIHFLIRDMAALDRNSRKILDRFL